MAGATKGIVNFVAMVLAFLAMGGFLYWLGVTAVPTETAVALEDDTAQAVSLSAFAQNPIMFEGDLVAVDGVEVQDVLGTQAFLMVLPDGSAYPIRLDASLAMGGLQIAASDQGRVTGTVFAMTDSVLDAWATEALFADDEQREAAAAVGSFLLATEVQLSGGTQGDGDAAPDA